MAIITFWSESKKEIGQTSTAIAVATQMAIEHNYKILLISTCDDNDLEQAFWQEKRRIGLAGLFDGGKKVNIDSGIVGLAKSVTSNRISPNIIPNYTKILFKNRLEVLNGFTGEQEDYAGIFNVYPDVISNASSYYDMVIVDLNRKIENEITNRILEQSSVIVYGLNQNNSFLEKYVTSRAEGFLNNKKNIVTYIGKYDKKSKYNSKNIARYLKEGRDTNHVSYNTLFMEACDEGTTADLFLKLKTIKTEDENVDFYNEVKQVSESIIYKIQELQLR